jgi:ribosome-binding factor A
MAGPAREIFTHHPAVPRHLIRLNIRLRRYGREDAFARFVRHDDDLRDSMPRHHQKDPGSGSQRQLRVGEIVRRAISDIFSHGGVHDPVLEGHLITVPEVRMSPDLKLATIYVMPLGGRDTDIVLEALERNRKFLRGEVARRVNLKFAPDIRFRVDERFDEAERIEKLLRTPAVQRDLKQDSDET